MQLHYNDRILGQFTKGAEKMSRMYRISLSESGSRHVRTKDGASTCLELLDILPKETMVWLLADELKKRGFEIGECGVASKSDDGVLIEIDIKTGVVNISSLCESEIKAEATVTSTGDEDHGEDGRKKLHNATEKKVKNEIQKKLNEQEAAIAEALRVKLDAKVGDIQRELDAISNNVTKEAVKVKARSFGDIESISEGLDGELVIKVRT